ncbi:hypothetical protein [Phyllobacterium endophyticum]|uniref:hypothetical protein n=1 Tax=Phyllobacterium endophyticum TaxID=1149773 RepID=UPI0011C6FB89|nr:hypothetical protein [Phyllobacterium endophyticum]TXR46399.1 hypothetical protein FVA77_25215 [Phyllobacterium endophyticum]
MDDDRSNDSTKEQENTDRVASIGATAVPNGPATPVEVPKAKRKRRMFQNGDTGRSDADD